MAEPVPRAQPSPPPFPWAWLAPSVLLLLFQATWGMAVYPRLPERIPRHFGPGGISGYWETNLLTAFLPLIVFAGMTVAMVACAFAMLRQTPSDRLPPTNDPLERAERAMNTNRPASTASANRLARALLVSNALVISALVPLRGQAWDTSGNHQGESWMWVVSLVLVVLALVPVGLAWWWDRQEHRTLG